MLARECAESDGASDVREKPTVCFLPFFLEKIALVANFWSEIALVATLKNEIALVANFFSRTKTSSGSN